MFERWLAHRKMVVGVVLSILLFAGTGLWLKAREARASRERDTQRWLEAQGLVDGGRPVEALERVPGLFRRANLDSDRAEAWSALELRAAEQACDPGRLVTIYMRDRERVLAREGASVQLVKYFREIADEGECRLIRERWRGRETMPELWFLIDADEMLAKGDARGAVAFLESRRFEGASDVGRLKRLAILKEAEDADGAWRCLEAALALDPRDAEIRAHRGRLLEKRGLPGTARLEILLAHAMRPDDSKITDQVAEFYRRNGDYHLAIHTLGGVIDRADSGWLGFKAFFWDRLLGPRHVDFSRQSVSAMNASRSILQNLVQMPQDAYWRDPAGEGDATGVLAQNTMPEIFWLQLLELLEDGEEAKAAESLSLNLSRGTHLQPGLERALLRTLQYRLKGTLQVPGGESQLPPQGETHAIFGAIEQAALAERLKYPLTGIDPDMHHLLTSPAIFGYLFLAADWLEAGLRLHPHEKTAASDMPGWTVPLVHRALLRNRGSERAAAFLDKHGRSDLLVMSPPSHDAGRCRELVEPGPAACDLGSLEVAFERREWFRVHRMMLELVQERGTKDVSSWIHEVQEKEAAR